ncbi:NADH pyrophosphatase [Marasmius sp. AFHP31]|nr:NADH pyrophosphatase [Marasmius sp. AFHP31]
MNYIPTNFFSGSPLNRLSWLRPSHKFLNAILTSPNTQWFLFNSGQPLISYRLSEAQDKPLKKITYFPTLPLLPLLGPSPFFGQSQTAGALLPDSEVTYSTEAARHLGIPVVFLKLHEQGTSGSALPEAEFKDNAEAAVQNLQGTPYFAVDVGDLETSEVDGVLRQVEEEQKVKFEWSEPRSAMGLMDPFKVAVFAEARSMVDWNYRHKRLTRQIVLKKIIGVLARNRRRVETYEVYRQMFEGSWLASELVRDGVKAEKALDGFTRIFGGRSCSTVIVNLSVGTLVCDAIVDEAFRVIAHYDIDIDQTDTCSEDANVSIEVVTVNSAFSHSALHNSHTLTPKL